MLNSGATSSHRAEDALLAVGALTVAAGSSDDSWLKKTHGTVSLSTSTKKMRKAKKAKRQARRKARR